LAGWPRSEATFEGGCGGEAEEVGGFACGGALAGDDEAAVAEGVKGALNGVAANSGGCCNLAAGGDGRVGGGVFDGRQVQGRAKLGFAETRGQGGEAEQPGGAGLGGEFGNLYEVAWV
jgi:hypothetical protein